MAKLVIGTDKTTGVPAIVKEVEVTPVEPYPLLSRVKDDSNNDVGIVCGYHTDANNVKYAVVCLDAQYRQNVGTNWLSSRVEVSNLPNYSGSSAGNVYQATETATFNCDKILEQATADGLTSSMITECRSHSFTINGITYYGQVPNMNEMLCILMHRTAINTNDPSVSGIPVEASRSYWISNQYDTNNGWRYNGTGRGGITESSKDYSCNTITILEIPIN